MPGIAILVIIFVAHFGYVSWLKNGIKARHITTTMRPDAIRRVFEQTVSRASWKIVDDGNPMLAQSSLATGIRQQIGLTTSVGANNRTQAVIAPHRLTRKLIGTPTKAHTLRIRMNSFAGAIQAQDPSAVVDRK